MGITVFPQLGIHKAGSVVEDGRQSFDVTGIAAGGMEPRQEPQRDERTLDMSMIEDFRQIIQPIAVAKKSESSKTSVKVSFVDEPTP